MSLRQTTASAEHLALDISKTTTDPFGAFWHQKTLAPTLLSRIDPYMATYEKTPLYGCTMGVKDLFMVQGTPTTAGSRMLSDFIAPYTSTVIQTLMDKGAFFTGKTSMDEFAMGSFSNTSSFGRTLCPWDTQRSAGGSSGGSAAAVAGGLVDFAVGSDTGGSVRQPASFCGIVGFKPTYGALSRYGMIPYASSLDQAGFLTKTVDDVRYLLEVGVAEHRDVRDPTSIDVGPYEIYEKTHHTIGYLPHLLETLPTAIAAEYQRVLDGWSSQGVTLVPVEIPLLDHAADIYYIIACSEASSNLARYQGVYYGKKIQESSGDYFEDVSLVRSTYFGTEVQRRILLGSFMQSSEQKDVLFARARQLRKALSSEIEYALSHCDFLMLPTVPMVAPRWDDIEHMTPHEIYLSDYLTVGFSLAGVPAISVPLGSIEGAPLGMQCVGSRFKDYQLVEDVYTITKGLV